MLVDIANEQSLQGHEVGIIVINNKLDSSIVNRIQSTVTLYQIGKGSSKINLFPYLKFLFILLFKCKPDIIHSHDASLGTILRYFKTSKNVLTVHGPGISVNPMKYYGRLFAISKAVKEDVKKRSGLECKLIYNGIYTDQIVAKNDFVPQKTFRVVMVKRLNHERKGQDLLIEAANIIIHKKKRTNFRFYLVGGGESEDFLRNLIHSYDLSVHVQLLGNWEREKVYDSLCNYDLFVHPSRFEGFGLTVVEAMAAKLPVVASNIEGPAEILENGTYGFLFENEHVEQLTEKILQAEKMYLEGEIKPFIDRAYNHCLSNFDIRKTAKNYCDNYLK